MTRRVSWFFVFVGIVFLAISFVLALGRQPAGRMLFWGLGALLVGVWLAARASQAAPAPPPPVVIAQAKDGGGAPAHAQAKSAPSGGGPPKGAIKGTTKPKGLAGLLKPKSKSRT